ncbi:hypothetical protein BV898_00797 [Hypsibius exemplaris]|uniref:Uncharacterized protein n=1 Tax=Hypsibius exemplaris TaxID=2072580 RepID=A0A1W0XC96_HYPEX|nr:hypothetical protein BV898_00797 [Hypsibius exemplaris]
MQFAQTAVRQSQLFLQFSFCPQYSIPFYHLVFSDATPFELLFYTPHLQTDLTFYLSNLGLRVAATKGLADDWFAG